MAPMNSTARHVAALSPDRTTRGGDRTSVPVPPALRNAHHVLVIGRDRKQKREDSDDDDERPDPAGSGGDARDGSPPAEDGKRRGKRSRKDVEKRWKCPGSPGRQCEKSYSRAEHLYRHQLNHKRELIYVCDEPGCGKVFYRNDLRARHQERHSVVGSHLHRKAGHANGPNPPAPILDPDVGREGRLPDRPYAAGADPVYGHQRRPPVLAPPTDATSPRSIETGAADDVHGSPPSHAQHLANGAVVPMRRIDPSPGGAVRPEHHEPGGGYQRATGPGLAFERAPHIYPFSALPAAARFGQQTAVIPQPPYGGQAGSASSQLGHAPFRPQLDLQPAPMAAHPYGGGGGGGSVMPFQEHFAPLPPSNYPAFAGPPAAGMQHYHHQPQHHHHAPQQPMDNMLASGGRPGHPLLIDSAFPAPVVGGGLDGSPPFMPDDSVASWIIGPAWHRGSSVQRGDLGPVADPLLAMPPQDVAPVDSTQPHQHQHQHHQHQHPHPHQHQHQHQYHNQNQNQNQNHHHHHHHHHHHSMSIASVCDPKTMTSEKHQQLLGLTRRWFDDTNEPGPIKEEKAGLLLGNINAVDHVLSVHSFNRYLVSYWYHFDQQMPILHVPTFCVNQAPNLLLVAMIAIGAATLDKSNTATTTVGDAGAGLATFLAWHLRGELFDDPDFIPPAKLWTLQALVLLEALEKHYSSRLLHERSQIHHATTVNLLRRSGALQGRSGLHSAVDQHHHHRHHHHDDDGNGDDDDDAHESWWHAWATDEATKRVSFAAFIIDSVHATMFSHTAIMVVHEMNLDLPCDHPLWSAKTPRAFRQECDEIRARGAERINFVQGLKRTFLDRRLKTNAFARSAVMAGLLNVCHHLNQRDEQVASLGMRFEGPFRWRAMLRQAFDSWHRDWDTSIASGLDEDPDQQYAPGSEASRTSLVEASRTVRDNIFESRVALHHLAHMGFNVDIVKCQTYARAERLLGCRVTPADYEGARAYMRNWAPTATARDAVIYSVTFLGQVLAPEPPSPETATATATATATGDGVAYRPRDDYLLNRPWLVYFAALVVWSYGYALDGPLGGDREGAEEEGEQQQQQQQQEAEKEGMQAQAPGPAACPRRRHEQEARDFLARMGACKDEPERLAELGGRNRCVGLLMVLKDKFAECRWQLLQEAATLLDNCVKMLTGEMAP